MYTHSIAVTEKQGRLLARGHTVQLRHENLTGSGGVNLVLDHNQSRRLTSAHRCGRGCRIQMSPSERAATLDQEGEGFGRWLSKAARKALRSPVAKAIGKDTVRFASNMVRKHAMAALNGDVQGLQDDTGAFVHQMAQRHGQKVLHTAANLAVGLPAPRVGDYQDQELIPDPLRGGALVPKKVGRAIAAGAKRVYKVIRPGLKSTLKVLAPAVIPLAAEALGVATGNPILAGVAGNIAAGAASRAIENGMGIGGRRPLMLVGGRTVMRQQGGALYAAGY